MTEIRLNTAPVREPPAWQRLDDLSTGQKATAVLLLLLLESGAPLIVDQPEDDLDNRFITEGIAPRMREEKQRRQFIFSTHHANIPVLGDAESIVGLSAAGEAESGRARIASEHTGSIDSPSIRDLVEEVLEGGREGTDIEVSLYRDRLEVISPGRLPNGVTVAKMMVEKTQARKGRRVPVVELWGA